MNVISDDIATGQKLIAGMEENVDILTSKSRDRFGRREEDITKNLSRNIL
jgi:hypothetical protein